MRKVAESFFPSFTHPRPLLLPPAACLIEEFAQSTSHASHGVTGFSGALCNPADDSPLPAMFEVNPLFSVGGRVKEEVGRRRSDGAAPSKLEAPSH